MYSFRTSVFLKIAASSQTNGASTAQAASDSSTPAGIARVAVFRDWR